MEQDKLPCDLDREVFERVWRRVMPEDRPDCPFVLNPTSPHAADGVSGPPSPHFDEGPLPWQAPVTSVPTGSLPAVQTPAPPAPRREEVPTPDNDVPCLGASSAIYGRLLQRYIDAELASWHTYQHLARRAHGGGSRVLSSMAADERRHAKRLSTAYFLISGVRYWPADRMVPPITAPLASALRQCFAAEQRAEAAYLAGVEEATDPCLQQLFTELAGDENAHVWLLRGILEQM